MTKAEGCPRTAPAVLSVPSSVLAVMNLFGPPPHPGVQTLAVGLLTA